MSKQRVYHKTISKPNKITYTLTKGQLEQLKAKMAEDEYEEGEYDKE